MSLISFRCCTKFNLIQTQAEKREKKGGSLHRKGIHNLLPAVGQLNCALNAITRSKNRSTNCANAARRQRERRTREFLVGPAVSLLFWVLSEY